MTMPKIFRLFLYLMAAVVAANGIWMLAHAWSWFRWIPGVTDTGQPNAHFIHDVGIAFLVFAAGFVWCAKNLERCRVVYLGITAFFAGHALGHVIEISIGQLPASHWLIDMPLVFLPALALVAFASPPLWQRATGAQ